MQGEVGHPGVQGNRVRSTSHFFCFSIRRLYTAFGRDTKVQKVKKERWEVMELR